MSVAAALALALAVLPIPERPLSGQPIAGVRLDVPLAQAADLERYLEIAPGDRFDSGAVRHVVELLYATGDYADVIVEAQPGPAGWELSFRPIPAPRLQQVRVEGDQVLSSRRVRDIALLRQKEPLWRDRLERAARDVALALVGEGFLEARVSAWPEPVAEGANAVFEIEAGPRVRVRTVTLQGITGQRAALLRRMARPVPGALFVKRVAERAAEKMRALLVKTQHWQAEVDVREAYDPRAAVVDLRFEVRPGTRTSVEYRGPVSRGLRRRLWGVLRDGRLQVDSIEDARERIENALREKGHRHPEVTYSLQPRVTGTIVVFEIKPGPRARVASVRLLGADELDESLQPPLSTRPGQPLRDALLDEDGSVLRDTLIARGFAQAVVQPEVAEGGGLQPVVFQVRPGPRTLVRTVIVSAPTPVPPAADPLKLRGREGRPYRVRDLAADRKTLLALYRNVGYLQAEVQPSVRFSEDRGEAHITFAVEPGPQTIIDHIVIAGLDHTQESVVRRELLIRENEPLGLDKIGQSRRRLSALGIFSRVSIRALDPDPEGHNTVLVSLDEGPRTTVAYGVGYAERELARGSIEVTRRNLFGRDRSLTLFGRGSIRGSRFLVSYREPHLFGKRRELLLTAFREQEDRSGFAFTRLGAQAQTAQALTNKTSLILRYSYQETDIFDLEIFLSDVDRQFRSTTVSGPSVTLVHDTRDDPLDPRGGRFLGADLQLSQSWLGGESFVKGFFQAAGYTRLGPRALLALNARIGLARSLGHNEPDRLPLPDRFFAGGDYSLRGFRTDFAGPTELSESGELVPTGGNALLVGGAELRVDATRYLSVAVFSDMGNVYPLVADLRLTDLRYTAGVGLRYLSAFGPLRVDWGYKLDRRPGESASRLHFTVGHAF